jgi:hypothetical protein
MAPIHTLVIVGNKLNSEKFAFYKTVVSFVVASKFYPETESPKY